MAEPDSSALADVIAIFLRRRGVQVRHISELRTGLELAVIERAAARLHTASTATAETMTARLEHSLRAETEQGPELAFSRGEDFHSTLGSLTGNPALQLVHHVTMRLGWQFFSQLASGNPQVSAISAPAALEPVHREITEALLAGDAEVALMRMRAHLNITGRTPPDRPGTARPALQLFRSRD